MKACLNFGEILEVGKPQVQEMQRIGDGYASPDIPGACEALTRQVRIVEGYWSRVTESQPTGQEAG